MEKIERILGVDTGGTFTDFVYMDESGYRVYKISSTPDRPDDAVVQGRTELGIVQDYTLHYGTTVATNAFLERKGAPIALLTTEGFEDVVEIGRQQRPDLYALSVVRPPSLVPVHARLGVRERISADGRVIVALDEAEIERVRTEVARLDVRAVAVVFLFSFINPCHEQLMKRALAELQIPVFISSEVFPEYREYERTVVTALNATLSPVMHEHISRLSRRMAVPIRVMASSGGTITSLQTVRRPVETLLSGPAAGVVAARYISNLAGYSKVITLDMGGTSTDVALIDGKPRLTSEAQIGGLPIRVPMIDIRTIGAGGGSIARFDEGGALKVGPESAGARPGPICYGRGGQRLTVTDANLFLGRLDLRHFLGGRMLLDIEATRKRMVEMATEVGLEPEELAEGILEVAETSMERLLRTITVERGYDPADYLLCAFGGAGGLHAVELARRLGIGRVLIPRLAGAISALGAVLTDLCRSLTRTLLLTEEEAKADCLEHEAELLATELLEQLKADKVDIQSAVQERMAFIRYVGQSYEIEVPYQNDPAEAFQMFDQLHLQHYGFARQGAQRELVNLMVRITVPCRRPALPRLGSSSVDAVIGRTSFRYQKSLKEGVLLDASKIGAGVTLRGPAILFEPTATVFLPPDTEANVDDYGNLLIEVD